MLLTYGFKKNYKLHQYGKRIDKLNRILEALKKSRVGLMVGEVSKETEINYAFCSKWLEVLHAKGTLGLKYAGNAKIYFIHNKPGPKTKQEPEFEGLGVSD